MSDSAATNSPESLDPPTVAYAPVREESLGRRAVRNSLWTVGSYAITNVVRLAGSLIITHLLAPKWIGVMAIVTTVLVGIRLFSDVGIGPAVVSNPRGGDERFLRTAFATQIFRGVMIWITACALAYPVSLYYSVNDPIYAILATLLPVAGFVAVIEGFRSTAIFRLQRQLDLKKIAFLEVVEILTTVISMVTWAWIQPTVWALVIPALIGSVTATSVSHLLLRDRIDRPQWHADCAKEMMKIGRWIFISTALTFLAGQFDRLIFGKLVDPVTLAVYWIAVSLSTMPFLAISKLGSSVLFPTFSRVADDVKRFNNVYIRARTALLFAGAIFVCGMIASSPFAIRMLYRSDYDHAGWMLQLLAMGIWFQIIDTTNIAGLLARQHAHWMVAGNLTKVIFMFTLVPIAFHYYGFGGALIALGIADGLRALTGTTGLIRNGLPWRGLLPDVLLPLAIAGVGLFAYAVTSHWMPAIESHFPATKMGRRVSNLILFSIAATQVFAVFLPAGYYFWKKSARAQLIAE